MYGANHEHAVLQLNIADWIGVAHTLKQYGPFDLVQWSSPCQPHSNANANKIANNPRKAVMLAAARLIEALNILHFAMENVYGAASSPVWQHTKAFLIRKPGMLLRNTQSTLTTVGSHRIGYDCSLWVRELQ